MVELEVNMKENQHWATFDDNEKDEFWKRSESKCDKNLHTDKKNNENGFENETGFVASPIVPLEESESHKERDLETNKKNITECEFPESEVSHKKNDIEDYKSLVSKPEVEIELEDESLASEEFEYFTKSDYDSVFGYSNEVYHSESGKVADGALGKSSELKSLKALFDSRSSDGSDMEHLSDQIKHSKTISESPAKGSPDDDSNKGISVLSYNSKADSATITFDFDSIKLESEGIDNNDKIANNLPTNSSKIANNATDENKAQGESSFSMAGPVSGIISHSGAIPYSGSISIRSDSSTTSARSFAFPILPNEWNSSPVRMAKADRKRYRSAKSWRNGLFCCRF